MLIVFINLNSEIVKMSTSSTVSVSLILIGKSSQSPKFLMAFIRGQVLAPTFIISDIIIGLVY